MTKLINGKEISAAIRSEIRQDVASMSLRPGLAVILVGNDPASQVYVRNKNRACEEVGIYSEMYTLPEETTQAQLLSLIDQLNESPLVHGILVQLPLPKHLNEEEVILRIDPRKDVDAFHPANVGKIMIGNYDFLPCTPAGVMELLKYSGIDPVGKECVILGRSNIVGKPQAMLLLHANATVTICHSRTTNLKEVCRRADILVSAVGRAGFVTADMVKDGAVVIDVGINRDENGKLCGDVAIDEVAAKTSYITPVPGGVGPMTITMLLKNTVTAAKRAESSQVHK